MAPGSFIQRGTLNRGRASRGTFATSRGAFKEGASRKFNADFIPTQPRAMRDKTNPPPPNSTYQGRRYDTDYDKRKHSHYTEDPTQLHTPNSFENERDENAAKRVQREQRFDRGNTRGRGDSRGRGGNRGRGDFETRGGLRGKGGSRGRAESEGRGGSRPPFANKSVRFDLPPAEQEVDTTSQPANPFLTKPAMTSTPSIGVNPFAQKPDTSLSALSAFGAPSTTSIPFGPPSEQPFSSASSNNFSASLDPTFASSNPSPFGTPSYPAFPSGNSSPFGATSKSTFPSATSNPFGTPSLPTPSSTVASNVFGKPSGPTFTNPALKAFGSPSQTPVSSATSSSPFAAATQSLPSTSIGNPLANNPFAKPSMNDSLDNNIANGVSGDKSSPFGTPSSYSFSAATSKAPASQFGAPSSARPSAMKSRSSSSPSSIPHISRKLTVPSTNGVAQKSNSPSAFGAASATNLRDDSSRSSKALAMKVEQALKRKNIHPPQWPGLDPTDERPINSIKPLQQYWIDYGNYRVKARAALISAGLIDDPDVPKKLSDAIDFKGTCEEMCPEWEKIDRIITSVYDTVEKDVYDDGSASPFPVMEKMVKRFGRAAAGQDAPLPADIRTAAALRRTTDYLFETVLGESELTTVYGFIWDRARAIRRDFVFHSYMSPSELVDQVYCLERMVRYHVVTAHLMSKEGGKSQVFSEQQELEQLDRALLSLMHAYEDCETKGVKCENEMEFRAYHIFWKSIKNPSYLAEIQNWGWKFWGESEIQLAVSLAEARQVTWENSSKTETDVAHNAFSRFFSIVEDKRVSYTMACFAETSFNYVRENILKTILKSYRKQRDQTKDWTVFKLNEYLHFDDEAELITFCEAHGLHIEQVDGIDYLSFEFGDYVSHPHPPLPQGYSNGIVERKRGDHTLLDVISEAIYENMDNEATMDSSDEDSLFVKDDSILPPIRQQAINYQDVPTVGFTTGQELKSSAPSMTRPIAAAEPENTPKPASIFDRIQPPKTFGAITAASNITSSTPLAVQNKELHSIFKSQPPSEASSLFTKQADVTTSSQTESVEGPKASPVSQSAPLFSFLQQSKPEQAPAPRNLLPVATTPAKGPKALLFSQNAGPSPAIQLQPSPTSSVFQGQAEINQPTSQLPAFVPSSSPLNPTQALNNAPPVVEPVKIPPQISSPKDIQVLVPQPQSQIISRPTKEERDAKINAVTEWVALGDEGLLQQFIAHQVELILHQAARIYVAEENQRIAEETEQRDREEADTFRYRSLAIRYVKLWREKSRLIRLRRKGREARQARREFAESKRALKAAQSASLIEDFRASASSHRQKSLNSSTSSQQQESLESMLDATGVLDGVHDRNGEVRAIAQADETRPTPKRRRSEKSTCSATSSTRQHKRGQSDNPLRRSLMSDPSYLQGGSRIHFMPNYDMEEDSRPRASGVQTDYFRLKARGITTLPNGTPLASSVAMNTISKKRSLDGIRKPATPQQSKLQPSAQSVPVKPSRFVNSLEDIQALKVKAKAMVTEDTKARQKRAFVDDEEALFERAKRVREQMDEGASWYRKQIEKHSASRSVS